MSTEKLEHLDENIWKKKIEVGGGDLSPPRTWKRSLRLHRKLCVASLQSVTQVRMNGWTKSRSKKT